LSCLRSLGSLPDTEGEKINKCRKIDERTKRDVYSLIVGRTLKKNMAEVRGKRIKGRRRDRKIRTQIRKIKKESRGGKEGQLLVNGLRE